MNGGVVCYVCVCVGGVKSGPSNEKVIFIIYNHKMKKKRNKNCHKNLKTFSIQCS